jgi:hypothetical protein
MISRRDFLRLCGATMAGAAFPPVTTMRAGREKPASAVFWGRALTEIIVRAAPRPDAAPVRTVHPDRVLTLTGAVAGWFKAEDGYVLARDVQPMVPYARPEVVTRVEGEGFWAEVIAPVTVARRWCLPDGPAVGRLGYGAVLRVVDVQEDDWGNVWYRDGEGGFWVQGLHVRRLDPAEDLAPLHPGAPDKHLFVDLARCYLTARERGRTVLTAPVSPGKVGQGISGLEVEVTGKRPSLPLPGRPGTPWGVKAGGLALHGAYWHNSFGEPREDGLVALAPAVAWWVYRWVEVGRTRVRVL